jgi:hypothetical protein
MIRFPCPCCGCLLEVVDHFVGQQTSCPVSGRTIAVPAAGVAGEEKESAPCPEAFADLVPDGVGGSKKQAQRARQKQQSRQAIVALVIGTILGAVGGETFGAGLGADVSTFLHVLWATIVGVGLYGGLGALAGALLAAVGLAKLEDDGLEIENGVSKSSILHMAFFCIGAGVVLGAPWGAITLGHQAGVGGNPAFNPNGLGRFSGLIGTILGMVPGVVWWLLPQTGRRRGTVSPGAGPRTNEEAFLSAPANPKLGEEVRLNSGSPNMETPANGSNPSSDFQLTYREKLSPPMTPRRFALKFVGFSLCGLYLPFGVLVAYLLREWLEISSMRVSSALGGLVLSPMCALGWWVWRHADKREAAAEPNP